MKHLALFSPSTIKAMYEDLSDAATELNLSILEVYRIKEDLTMLSEIYEGLTGEKITEQVTE